MRQVLVAGPRQGAVATQAVALAGAAVGVAAWGLPPLRPLALCSAGVAAGVAAGAAVGVAVLEPDGRACA